MVYCGKPSKACAVCRAKRRKCDRVQPVCGQCVRAKTTCGGYHDQLNVGFRDQTKDVAFKVTQSSKRTTVSTSEVSAYQPDASGPSFSVPTWSFSLPQTNNPPEEVGSFTLPPTGNPPEDDAEEIVRSDSMAETSLVLAAPSASPVPRAQSSSEFTYIPQPLPSADDLATSAFFKTFMPGPPGSRNQFDYLPTILNSSQINGILTKAIISIGSHTLAERNRDKQLLLYSKRKYSSTLTTLQDALRDSYRAKSDEVLVTILLMSQFESIISPDMQSMLAHLEGAQALLKLRGLEALRTVIGMRLFASIRGQIALTSIINHKKVPDFITELSEQCWSFPSNDKNWASPMTMIAIKFGNIRARVYSGEGEDIHEILASYRGIEHELENWATEIPAHVQYTRMPATPSEFVLTNYADMYKDYYSYTIWNYYRSVRIMCAEAIITNLRRLLADPEKHLDIDTIEADIRMRQQVVENLCLDICASMPYFTGVISSRNNSRPSLDGSETRNTSPASEGIFVMWPLFTIADCSHAPAHMRRFAIMQMRIISQHSGNKMAAVLAERLEKGPSGSYGAYEPVFSESTRADDRLPAEAR